MKEILRVVNAKRMGVAVSRRFSATMDPASADADPTISPGSAAPAAAAPAATDTAAAAPAAVGSTGALRQRQTASGGDNNRGVSGGASVGEHRAAMPPLGSRNPFENTGALGGGGRGGKVEAAADLLARVRGQLERSEKRTKGLPVERQGVGDIAPPR